MVDVKDRSDKAAVIQPVRAWPAFIDLSFEPRADNTVTGSSIKNSTSKTSKTSTNKTVITHKEHKGPLRVQRPFYPESDGTCHTYLLHPPGGIVLGDELTISANLAPSSRVLLTTPSAGRVYGITEALSDGSPPQVQQVNLHVGEHACCEWLPQETILFDGAKAQLNTRVNLTGSANFIGWEAVRLGRIASGEAFTRGYFQQRFEIWRDDQLQFLEKNALCAGDPMQHATWGLQGQHTLAMLVATVTLPRDTVDQLVEQLNKAGEAPHWGLTQKSDFFIARYLGSSIIDCKAGLTSIWHVLRRAMQGKAAVEPRIWHT